MKKVALITGASSGIGRASALALAKAGHNVAGTGRREAKLHALRDEISALPDPHGEFLPLVSDVTNPQSVAEAVNQTVERFGRLDVLVANAGVGHRGALVDSEWDDLQTLLRTNLDGVVLSVRAAVPAMRAAGGGHIILISSVSWNLVSPYAALYAASKAFVSNLGRSLRLELADDNIYVSDFRLGRTATEFNQNRLGQGARTRSSVSSMSADTVAEKLVAVVEKPQDIVVMRFTDRLLMLANRLIPNGIGRFVKREYS